MQKIEKLNSLEQYQQYAQRTCPSLGTVYLDNEHMICGVFTEFGETVDILKKYIAYGKAIDWINFSEELIGDVSWYLVNYARMNSIELPDLTNVTPEKTFKNLKTKTIGLNGGLSKTLRKISRKFDKNPDKYLRITIIKIYALSQVLNIDYYQSLTNNINKLVERFPLKFTTENALNRNVDKERIELEKDLDDLK